MKNTTSNFKIKNISLVQKRKKIFKFLFPPVKSIFYTFIPTFWKNTGKKIFPLSKVFKKQLKVFQTNNLKILNPKTNFAGLQTCFFTITPILLYHRVKYRNKSIVAPPTSLRKRYDFIMQMSQICWCQCRYNVT